MKKYYIGIVFFVVFTSCVSSSSSLKPQLLDSFTIKTGTEFGGYEVGGLSEIELHNDGSFIALSDARGREDEGPSRFYKGKINFQNGIMTDVTIEQVVALLQSDGKAFPPNERDPESFVLLGSQKMLFASEGSDTIEIADLPSGIIQQKWKNFLPAYYHGENGLRKNQGMEGLSLTPDGKTLFIAVESALVGDGDVATLEKPAKSRILKMQKFDGNYQVVAEYAYSISKIPTASSYGIQDNGVSAILALDETHLLVVERNGYAVQEGYSHFDFDIRIYVVDLTQASNILGKAQISGDTQMVGKKMLFDLGELVESVDNVEGISFGPDLGRQKTIILVTDNNFAEHQANKIYQIGIPVSMFDL